MSPLLYSFSLMKKGITEFAKFLRREFILVVFVVLLVVLSFLSLSIVPEFPQFVDWRTIFALTGLMVITRGFNESQFFQFLACRILRRVRKENHLAFGLILLSVGLSTFLTNDITLFIMVPLSLQLQDRLKNDISRLIAFEAIAVNVGSSLTPIGNPQNLFLWHQWRLSFWAFIVRMSPITLTMVAVLAVFIVAFFSGRQLQLQDNGQRGTKIDRRLLITSSIFMVLFVISMDSGFETVILIALLLWYVLFHRDIMSKIDWLLLMLFIVMFIDFHILASISWISKAVNRIDMRNPGNVFLFSAGLSQFISNVPAAIFASKFTTSWRAISYGVNVGGNGLIIGSMANIIAIRMAGGSKLMQTFHKYSIPYFFITLFISYLLLF